MCSGPNTPSEDLRAREVSLLRQKGFTLLELVTVVCIMGLVAGMLSFRGGSFAFWKEDGFIRRLSETIVFLHHQAVADQAWYRLEFNLEKNEYRVGVMRSEDGNDSDESLSEIASDAGNLTLELAAFLSPSVAASGTVIPPPNFPSLANPVDLPGDMVIEDVRTMRGLQKPSDSETAFILFSPRGFSEFAVIHLKLASGKQITTLVNPFTGTTEIYPFYKDFEWTYGKKEGRE